MKNFGGGGGNRALPAAPPAMGLQKGENDCMWPTKTVVIRIPTNALRVKKKCTEMQIRENPRKSNLYIGNASDCNSRNSTHPSWFRRG